MATTDRALLDQWRSARDAESFKALSTRYASMVYATCLRILNNRADAEEVTQECFETLSQLRSSPHTHLGPWLHKVATNQSLNQSKSDRRRASREQWYADGRPRESEIEWKDIYTYLDETVEALPEKLRIAVVSHFLEDETHEAIAQREGVSRTAITERCRRGVEEIRRVLVKRGVPIGAAALATMLTTETALAAPATLAASLGKIAIMGAKATGTMNAALLGGTIMTKQVALFAVVAVVVAAGAYVMLGGEDEEPSISPTVIGGAEPDAPVVVAEAPPVDTSIDSQSASSDGSLAVSEETNTEGEQPEAVETEIRPAWNDAGLGEMVIAGVVNDEVGKPIEGVFVQGFGGRGNPYTHTDEAGVFRLIGLAEGRYSLQIQDDQHTAESLQGIRAGEENLVVVLRDRAAVSGTIVNAVTGTGITSFEILSTGGIQGKLSRPLFSRFIAFDDPQGRFQVENVSLGNSTLIVRAPGYAPAFEALRLDSSDPIDGLTIALEPGLIAEGQVLNEAGEPVPGAWLFKEPIPVAMLLDSLNSEMSPRQEKYVDAFADAEGRFTIDTLTAESRTLAAFHPDYGNGEAALTWNGLRLSGVDIVLSRAETGSIQVSVTTTGVPGENSVVWVGPVGGMGDMLQRGRTDGDGKCMLDGIPPGTWGVTVVYPGQINSWLRRVVVDCEVVAGRTTNVQINFQTPSASLAGIVMLDGESPLGGNIMLTMTRPTESEWYMATWDDDGTFSTADIVPGVGTLSITVFFSENRMRSRSFDLEFADGEQKAIEIDLSGGRTLTGVMQGLAATEHGSVVALRGEQEITEVSLEMITSIQPFVVGSGIVAADGSYSIEGLDPGIHTLLAMVSKTVSSDAFDDMRWTTTVIDVSETEENTVDFDMR